MKTVFILADHENSFKSFSRKILNSCLENNVALSP